MKKLILSLLLFLLIPLKAWAAVPIIYYSDLTAGPNTGGQNNNGVFVTVWGNNFGATQGTSTVTVGSGFVSSYLTWSNTMITFQLGASVTSGNIVVSTSSGAASSASSPTPFSFTVQTGNIYFVQPGAATNGSGAITSPFNHAWYAYSIIQPGDTVYIRAGTITDESNGCTGYHSFLCAAVNGTSTAPISWIAYPNETVTIINDGGPFTWCAGSSGSCGDTAQYIFRAHSLPAPAGDYWTVSKLFMQTNGAPSTVAPGNNWKVVGNNLTAANTNYGVIDLTGNAIRILGNEIHGTTQSSFNNLAHAIYVDGPNNGYEVGWNYMHNNSNSGWEISNYHNGPRIGTTHDNLIDDSSSPGSVKGILVDGCGDFGTDNFTTMETNNVSAYNNIIINAGQASNGGAMQINCGTNQVYNNTIWGSGTENQGMIQLVAGGIGPGGGNQVTAIANNILYGNNAGLYISDSNGAAPNWSFISTIAKNNYYGEGNGPSNDTTAINADPKFVTNGSNFHLQSSSPDIGVGYNTTAIVAFDYDGVARPNPPDVGAYQYATTSCFSNGTACTTNGQCCSNYCIASVCGNAPPPPTHPGNITLGLIGATSVTGKTTY